MRNQKGQGALEYLLLIGGAVLVAAIVIVLLLGINSQSNTQTGLVSAAALCNQKTASSLPSNPTAVCSKNGAWVAGDDTAANALHTSDGKTNTGVSINLSTVVISGKVYACGNSLPSCTVKCDPFADPRPYTAGMSGLVAQTC